MPVRIADLELYSVEELSERLGVQQRTIRAYLATGRLKGRKLARKWYVSARALEEYFSQPEPLDDEEKERSDD